MTMRDIVPRAEHTSPGYVLDPQNLTLESFTTTAPNARYLGNVLGTTVSHTVTAVENIGLREIQASLAPAKKKEVAGEVIVMMARVAVW